MPRIVYFRRWRDLPSNPDGYPPDRPAECAEADDAAPVPKGFRGAERMTAAAYRALEQATASVAAPISAAVKQRAAVQSANQARRDSVAGALARLLMRVAADRLTPEEFSELREISGE